jgi:orotate phosphoribosyltransferase-like protein
MNISTVIDILCQNQGATRNEVADAAKVSPGTAKYWLDKAVKEGKVRCMPQRIHSQFSPRFRYWTIDHFYDHESEMCK